MVKNKNYPHTPHPKERAKRIEKATTAINHMSSFFIKTPPY